VSNWITLLCQSCEYCVGCASCGGYGRTDGGTLVENASRAASIKSSTLRRNLTGYLLGTMSARHNGHSWASIGAMVGTSGEAARQRFGQSVNAS
jgi:hypothetical protein